MKRTDIHTPSNLVAADYEFLEYFYQGPANDEMFDVASIREVRRQLRASVEAQEFKGNWFNQGTCDHCGAHFHYGAVFAHLPTGDQVVVGNTCANDSFAPSAVRDAELKKLKAIVASGRARNRKSAIVEAFLDANPGLREALALADKHVILDDLSYKLNRWGNLSPKQVELADKLAKQIAERAAREAAQALEPKVPVVTGVRTVTGTILATKVQDGQYGTTYKMLVKLDGGEKVWGSIPANLNWEPTPDRLGSRPTDLKTLRGRTVTFTATFEVGEDPCFGFFKRPRKATLKEVLGEESSSV